LALGTERAVIAPFPLLLAVMSILQLHTPLPYYTISLAVTWRGPITPLASVDTAIFGTTPTHSGRDVIVTGQRVKLLSSQFVVVIIASSCSLCSSFSDVCCIRLSRRLKEPPV